MSYWNNRGPGGAAYSERGPEPDTPRQPVREIPKDTRTKAERLADRRAQEAREAKNKRVALDRALAQISEMAHHAAPKIDIEVFSMSKQSQTVGEIYKAFIGAQAEIANPTKSKQGHGYKYAELSQLTEMANELLPRHGMGHTQTTDTIDGQLVLVTTLFHSSGEWIQGFYPLEKAGMHKVNDAQQMGAAITYARRYTLAAILGIAQEDDDAACLTRDNRPQQPQRQQPQRQQQQQQRPQQQQQQQGQQLPPLQVLEGQTLAAVNAWIGEGYAADHIVGKLATKYTVTPQVVKSIHNMLKGGN